MNSAEILVRRIAERGPIPVADYMAAANAHYYATRDPLGAGGDFTTAPEISQMFGELVGVWLADLWQRAAPAGLVHYVEFGPGRGTLAQDALRVLAGAKLSPRVHLVETSPILRAVQADACPGATWHDAVDTLPTDAPLLIVANEFFDALPIHQHVRVTGGWRMRMLNLVDGAFQPVLGHLDTSDQVPPALRDSPHGSLFETSPASHAIVRALAERLAAQGGALLVIDYGHHRTAIGETLQAVKSHAPADPFAEPGERDLTAHVDFDALAAAAREGAARPAGVKICGPRTQGEWLTALGLTMRAAALARADPPRAPEIHAARERLAGADQMGKLFKVMACVSLGWPQPEGF